MNRRIVFVAPHLTGESLRSARAVKQLDEVELLGVCQQPPHSDSAAIFNDIVRIHDVHDPKQLVDAVRGLTERHGIVDRIVTVHETLLMPVAQASETLSLQGMSAGTVRRVLDKSQLKCALRAIGIEMSRDCVLTSRLDAERFVDEIGFPMVIKPLAGSGGLMTWRIDTDEQLETALDLLQPSAEHALFVESYVDGQELCIDTITIDNEPRFYSICCYRPTILEALESPRIQWSCLMPREAAGQRFQEFIQQGLAAVRALAVGNAVTHMEGFLQDGGGVRFTDATLRPAGARIGPMLSYACDIDSHRTWARATVDGEFDGPWERKHAVGTIFLRGQGQGRVRQVEGLQTVRRQLGELVVDSSLPQVGTAKAVTYTGDGYITVRHPETRAVENALDFIADSIVIRYTDSEVSADSHLTDREQWSLRLRHFQQRLYKPSWDNDSLPQVGDG